MSGENSRPEAKASIVADFDIGEAEVHGLAEKGSAVGGAVGVPAGGEGEGGRGHEGMSFAKRGVGAKGFFWKGAKGEGGERLILDVKFLIFD